MNKIVGNISYGIGWLLIVLAELILAIRNFLVVMLLMTITCFILMVTLLSFSMIIGRLLNGELNMGNNEFSNNFLTNILINSKWYWELLVVTIGSLTMWKGFITVLPS